MPTYVVNNSNGQTISTVVGVLAPVPLTAVSTDGTTSILTCASTTGVYPGMAICAPNVPMGSFVHAVKSSTTLELWRSDFSTAGVWTTSLTNAISTASASGGLGHALGFSPFAIVSKAYAQGAWRNLFRATSSVATFGLPGATNIPTYTVATGTATLSALSAAVVSDDFAASPVKRHNGEFWGIYILVSTGGLQTLVRADPTQNIVLSSAA